MCVKMVLNSSAKYLKNTKKGNGKSIYDRSITGIDTFLKIKNKKLDDYRKNCYKKFNDLS